MEEAPVYYPSEEEFKNPLRYVEKIRAEAEIYGLCKIVPPSTVWKPTFALDPKKFRFKTRKQVINELEGKTRMSMDYVDLLQRFHMKHLQKPIQYIPAIEGNPLDFYSLKNIVNKLGGYEKVKAERLWLEVAVEMMGTVVDDSDDDMLFNVAKQLQKYYQKYILPYEQFKSLSSNKSERSLPSSKSRWTLEHDREDSQYALRNDYKRFKPSSPQSPRTSSRRLSGALSTTNRITFKPTVDCEVCRVFEDGKRGKIYCTKCGNAYHKKCCNPPIENIADDCKFDWECPSCIDLDVEFGFEDGNEYTLAQFETMANRFKAIYFAKLKQANLKSMDLKSLSEFCESVGEFEVVKEFWRLASSQSETVAVEYGADIHTTVTGSGFPTKDKDPKDPLTYHPWNLNNIPVLHESLLRHIDHEISGMTIPWLYAGMCFSTFCWHIEDHNSYSVNYMHFGEPKVWYGVPSNDSEKFEASMRQELPELFETHPDALSHITTLLSPGCLMENDVNCYVAVQRKGEFIITFPRSYHAGFNVGFNLAEAVNFTLPDWLSFGLESVYRYREMRKLPVFSHEELLTRIALTNSWEPGPFMQNVQEQLRILCTEEVNQRQDLITRHPNMEIVYQSEYETCKYVCQYCKSFLFFSRVTCKCQGGKHACHRHTKEVCKCSFKKKTLHACDLTPILNLTLTEP